MANEDSPNQEIRMIFDRDAAPTWRGPLTQFLDANDFDAETRESIRSALAIRGRYEGGGGAESAWTILT